MVSFIACSDVPNQPADRSGTTDLSSVVSEVEAAVWAFHAADTSRDALVVAGLLWPEYTMLADGERLEYNDVVAGSQTFMAGLASFSTDWSDLRITPLNLDHAVSSFLFRDSIVTTAGELIQSRGPTTFVWQRRDGEWRVLYGDSDHYTIEP